MLQPVSIIAELEEAVRSGSAAKRISTLRQVTDLFLRDADRLNKDQVKVDRQIHDTEDKKTPDRSGASGRFRPGCTPSDVSGLIPSCCRLGRLGPFLDWARRQLQYRSPLPGN